MKSRNIILALALAAAALPLSAKQSSNVLDLKESITDDAIIFPESFEADAQKMLESWYIKNYTDTDDRYRTSTNPSTSDAVIKERLAELPTVIDMPFNQIVRSYIDRYMDKGRPMVASLLGLATYYMPIFEQALEAEQLPQELKYLPVIESALNPNAVSRSGAGGLWQFMPAAAKGYDLEISSLVDERRDPYKSSQKAAKMLKDLYETYGDWSLALAAYNCGPGNVNKAIRRAGGDPKQQDFWSIYKYLSPETRGYVPMFIAANYVMNYYKEHNISPVLPTRPLVTDTVGISSRVHFDQISAVLDIPKEELRILNPQFRADVIPGSAKHQYMLILPSRQAQAYIMSEPEILAYEAQKYARRTEVNPGEGYNDDAINDENSPLLASDPVTSPDDEVAEEDEDFTPPARENSNLNPRARTVTHTVGANETINDIAELYKVRVSDIRSWNSLRRNAVREGQELRIETEVPEADLRASNKKKPVVNNNATANNTPKPTTPVPASKPAVNNNNNKTVANANTNNKPVVSNNNKAAANNNNKAAVNNNGNTNKKVVKQETTVANNKNNKKNDNTAANGKNNKKNDNTAANGKNNKKNDNTAANGKNNKKNDNAAANGKNNKKNDKNEKQTAKSGTHDIQSGESLSTIARKHGVTVDELKKANNLKDDMIRAGDQLKVPSKSTKNTKNSNVKGTGNEATNKKGANNNQTKKKK